MTIGRAAHLAIGGANPMERVNFRVIHLHDLSYAVEVTKQNGAQTLAKGFNGESDAEAWLSSQQHRAPEHEVWMRQPTLRWH